MAFMVISSRASGMVGSISRGERGMELMCWMATDTAVSPSKGSRPVIISYSTTPAEYRSLRASMWLPRACSGEI